MRRLFILSLLLLSSFAQADQIVQLPPFNALKSEGVFDMDILVGGAQSVMFKGQDEKLNKLVVRVVNGELQISASHEKSSLTSLLEGKFMITVPALRAFKGKGAGKVNIQQITGDKFDISFEGAGSLEASGKIKSLKLTGLGVGEINTRKLLAENADVDLEGVGDAKVYVSNQLNAVVKGVGSLTYFGKPRSVKNSATGIGRIGAGD